MDMVDYTIHFVKGFEKYCRKPFKEAWFNPMPEIWILVGET